jgi:2'-5' RNA ligase
VRLFAAVALPEPVERAAGEWLASLEAGFGRGVRWVRPEGLHLTLHFFGAVPAEARPRIEAALAAGVAAGGGPFELALEGLGAFPSPARARVVWVGAAGPGVERLVRLQRAVAEAVAAAGFPSEGRALPGLSAGERGPWEQGRRSDRRTGALSYRAGTRRMKEQRPFHAHLTLGRVEGAPPPGLAAAIAAGAGRPLGRWVVDAVTLLRSERAPGGSRYTPLAAWRLEHALG